MNWLLEDELAKVHLDALHRASGGNPLRREQRLDPVGRMRMAVGMKFIRAGLGITAGIREARLAPEDIRAARDEHTSEGL